MKKRAERSEMRYIVEDLFPSGQVHLMGGPSGGGKTTLTFQLYKAIQEQDATWLGREIKRPLSWAYISGDRATRSVMETQERIGVSFPVFSLVDEDLISASLTNHILPRLSKLYGEKPNIIYIDGFTALVPGAKLNDYGIVANWLGSLQRYCDDQNITIIGACHTTKTKENERYKNPRQKIAGSVAWAGFSETVILIEPPDAEGAPASARNVSLLPRNKPEEFFTMNFDDNGILQMPEKLVHEAGTAELILPGLFKLDKPGILDYGKLVKDATAAGLSRRTFDRYLAKLVEIEKIERVRKGVYSVLGPEGRKNNPPAEEQKTA